MRRTLAESANFVVSHEFELAFATEKSTGREMSIGSHYGDPTCAVIAPDESWFAVGGEGVTVMHRRRGELTFLRDTEEASDVRIHYEDPMTGEQRVLAGVERARNSPRFVKAMTALGNGRLQVFLDDDEDSTVVVEIGT
jgi:hypothetical protein